MGKLKHRLKNSSSIFLSLDKDIYRFLQSAVLSSVSLGIFSVAFNLYALSLGISEARLGAIISAAPLATALVAIPVSCFAERAGYRNSLALVLLVTGFSQLTRVIVGSPNVMATATFIGGLGSAGEFVIRTPLLAESSVGFATTLAFSLNQLLTTVGMSLGNITGGYLPGVQFLQSKGPVFAYRVTLVFASLLALLSAVPIFFIKKNKTRTKEEFNLAPYLWGIDTITKQLAVISLFRGLSMGFVGQFINVYFINYLGVQREFFGTVMALAIIPITIGVALGPVISKALGPVRSITLLRTAIPIPLVVLAVTRQPIVAVGAEWVHKGLSMMETPLSFSLSMRMGNSATRPAIAAWLHVTFVLGNAITAPLVGLLYERGNYALPFYLAAASTLVAGVLNQIMFQNKTRSLEKG